ncbi:Uncharacterised protein [Bacillus subtilis]|nr:Uncharacterised protein [Bacillus subtilis]
MRLKFGKLIQALSPAQLIALYYFSCSYCGRYIAEFAGGP